MRYQPCLVGGNFFIYINNFFVFTYYILFTYYIELYWLVFLQGTVYSRWLFQPRTLMSPKACTNLRSFYVKELLALRNRLGSGSVSVKILGVLKSWNFLRLCPWNPRKLSVSNPPVDFGRLARFRYPGKDFLSRKMSV